MRARLFFALVLCSCNGEIADDDGSEDGDGDVGDPGILEPADDSVEVGSHWELGMGDLARVCNASSLNQRTGPGTSYEVLRAMPEGSTVKLLDQSGTWFQNDWGGKVGWSSGTYLCPVVGGGESESPASFDVTGVSRENVLSIAEAAVGFSYWWGGGRFDTGASAGACYGGCPDCTHSGSYGADCSGFVAKAWLLPAALPMDANKHPYSTYHFYNDDTVWHDIPRAEVLPGDALVYRSGNAGHIVLYEKDDPWGSFWSYEARGCSYGIVHNIRTANSSYKAIRRDAL